MLSLLTLCASLTFAQTDPPAVDEAIRKATAGWTIEAVATGDLNKDGVDDTVVALSKPGSGDDKVTTLQVFFGKTLFTEGKTAFCTDCGGARSGGSFPFELSIAKGVLRIDFMGGSREITQIVTKWMLLKGGRDLRLIGITRTDSDSIASEKGQVASVTRDVNLSTLKMDETVATVKSVGADGIPKYGTAKKSCAVDPKFKGRELRGFHFQTDDDFFEVPKCSDASL
jgi:hypothetical protein